MLLLGCVFVLLVLLVRAKSFCKKNKEFKTSLVIKTVLAFLFSFLQKDFTNTKKHKSTKRYKQTKIKNALKKHLKGKKSLTCLFAFCAFAWLCLCAFVLLVRGKSFCKKEFKTSLITSFTLLLEYEQSITGRANGRA